MVTRAQNVIASGGYANGATQPMLDIGVNGQFGYAPDLTNLISNQAYVQKNLQLYLLRAPGFFSLMPNPDKWVASLRALVETHARTVEGYNAALTVDIENHPVGGGGEQQHEFTNVTRAISEPVLGVQEKYGMPFTTFLHYWIQYGLMDPETKLALIGTISDQSKVPTDWLYDWYGMTVLALEPDPTGRKVLKSWITTNMWPKGTGDITGKRDLTSPGEMKLMNIEFTGTSQFSLGTNVFAQKFLDKINMANANPYLRPAFMQEIDADVAAAASTGYVFGVDTLAKSAVTGGAKI